jgi:hypothetical protein
MPVIHSILLFSSVKKHTHYQRNNMHWTSSCNLSYCLHQEVTTLKKTCAVSCRREKWALHVFIIIAVNNWLLGKEEWSYDTDNIRVSLQTHTTRNARRLICHSPWAAKFNLALARKWLNFAIKCSMHEASVAKFNGKGIQNKLCHFKASGWKWLAAVLSACDARSLCVR